MEYEQMQAFLAVAGAKSFTRAAEKLHVAQSTITTRIKQLEEKVGKSLFERDSRRVELSEAGRTLLPYVQRALELMQEGELVTRMQGQFAERLVVGSLHSLWTYMLYPVVSEYRRLHPETSLRLLTGHSPDVVRKMLDGLIDVGIVYIPQQHPDIEVIPLFNNSISLVGSPVLVQENEELTMDTLQQRMPYIHMDWGPPFTEWHEREVGKHYLPGFQADETTLFLQFLLNGEGVGFLIDYISRDYIRKGLLKPIPFRSEHPMPERTTYLIYPKRKQQSPALRAFLDTLYEWRDRQFPAD